MARDKTGCGRDWGVSFGRPQSRRAQLSNCESLTIKARFLVIPRIHFFSSLPTPIRGSSTAHFAGPLITSTSLFRLWAADKRDPTDMTHMKPT